MLTSAYRSKLVTLHKGTNHRHCIQAQQPHCFRFGCFKVSLHQLPSAGGSSSSSSSSMYSFTQGSHACRTVANATNSSMQRATAAVHQHTGVVLQSNCRRARAAAITAAATYSHRVKACLYAQHQPHHAAHHTACVANSKCSISRTAPLLSRALSKGPARLTRCCSTPSPAAGQTGPVSISWLCNVQAWPSQAAAHSEPSSSSSSSSSAVDVTNGNGAASSNGGLSRNSNGGCACVSAEQDFAALQAAELSSMQFDAIVVLAGGLLPDGGLPSWAERRLDVARDLHMLLGRKPPILCSGGGTPHKPSILGSNRHVLHESTAMASYLMARGVAAADILKETASYDTVGNTYFSLAVHALPAAWARLAVVTSDFHMPRSRALFVDIYRLAGSSMFGNPHRFSLTFLSASDEGCFDEAVYAARLTKEAASLAHWQGVAAGLRSLPELQAWLHSDHLCYAVQRQHEFGKRTIKDQKLLESY